MRDESLGFLLGRALRLHQHRTYQRLGERGPHPGQAPLLFALWHRDGQVQKDLATKLQLSSATVAVSLRRLEQAGLVERRRDPEDHRISRVYVTEAGWRLRDEVEAAIAATDAEALAGFSPEEQRLLRQLLDRLVANLKRAARHRC